MNGTPPETGSKGFILLYVLWLTVAISAMVMLASGHSRRMVRVESSIARRYSLRTETRSVFNLAKTLAADKTLSSGYVFNVTLGRCNISMTDANALLNPNLATPEELYSLGLALGLTQQQASVVSASIADWIDADQTIHPNGAEASYYQALTPPYECADKPLHSLDELLMVRGITPPVYAILHDFLSVESHEINFRTAPKAVIEAVTGNPDIANKLIEFRKKNWLDDTTIQAVIGTHLYESLKDRLTFEPSGVYRLTVTGRDGQLEEKMSEWLQDKAGK